jgi:hypothetical protein
MFTAFNPSSLVDLIPIAISQTVAAAATVDIPDANKIDTTKYEHMYVVVNVGTNTGTATTVKFFHADTNSVLGTELTTKVLSIASGDSTKTFEQEIRCRGLGKFFNVQVAAVGGTNIVVTVNAWGVKAQDSSELAALATTSALSKVAKTLN